MSGLLAMHQLIKFLPELFRGALTTAEIAVLGSVFAIIMGFVAGFARLSRFMIVRAIAMAYVEIFRGTSLLVQLFWLYFVLPFFGISLNAFAVAVIGLGLCLGAYGSEVVRGAILAVHQGQYEAAVALNMTHYRMMKSVILPQAIIAMLPPWGNLLIELLKGTALVSLITIHDLTFKAYQLNLATFRTVEIFTLVLFIYLGMSLCITAIVRSLEHVFGRSRGKGKIQ